MAKPADKKRQAVVTSSPASRFIGRDFMTLKQEFGVETLSAADAGLVRCAMRRGATRRELLGLLTAGGMALTTAGGVLGTARRALAEEPRRGGRIRVAVPAASTADTLDPAKQSFADRLCSLQHVLQRPDRARRHLDAAAGARRIARQRRTPRPGSFKLRKGVHLPRRQAARRRPTSSIRSMRHKDPAVGSKAKIARRPDRARSRRPARTRCRSRSTAPNADLPVILGTSHFLIVKDGTTDFTNGDRHRPVQVQGVHSPACARSACATRTTGSRASRISTRSSSSASPTRRRASTRCCPATCSSTGGQSALDRPRSSGRRAIAVFETKSGNYTDLIDALDAQPDRQPGFRARP